MGKHGKDYTIIRKMYEEECCSIKEIASQLGCTRANIQQKLDCMGVERIITPNHPVKGVFQKSMGSVLKGFEF